MKLKNIIQKCNDTIKDRMYDAIKEGSNHILALVDITENIQVDIEITGYEKSEVCVYNRKDLDRYYPNIENMIIDNLPLWPTLN